MKSYYELLGASANDDAEALKKAFRKAVKVHHPDLHPDDPDALERFREIIAANTLLRDTKHRATYDWFLQLERESFQLMLKRRRLPLKRMHTIAVIAALSALIGGYGLWATVPTSGNVGIDRGQLAAATSVAPAVTQRPASLPPLTTSSSAQNALDTFPARAPSRQLTIDAVRLRQTDALLTISAEEVGSDTAVVVGGLAPGSTLSAGVPAGPNMWRLSSEDLGNVVLAPPRGFVGAMDLTLELRLADQTAVDRKSLQLEWSANETLAPPKSQQFGAAEIALMVQKGAALIRIGNVGGARMLLQHAAEAGDPAAALALAETYDPLVLRRLDVKGGITSDIALANIWYEKAKDLGSIVASERLKALAGLAK
jgi:hypothetical protein